MRQRTPVLLGFMLMALTACGPDLPEEVARAYAALPDTLDFNVHVRPVLSDRCWSCHGPDGAARKADLRLDKHEGILARAASGDRPVVPGKPGRSALIERILAHEDDFLMPPPESKLTLDAREKAILVKWVDDGARWKPHWSMLPPRAVPPPAVRRSDWASNPIDQFVLARLEREGLEPSPQAEPERLLRRLFMDLTGLPPGIETQHAFLADPSEEAYTRIVDSLLQTPAHAERLAMEWMDVSRYADSHGYHADGWRMMWPWRDWVIQAFADNMPYDRFVSWQLAGDLMPNATHEQILATAFLRNHPQTAEGGVVDEEFRIKYVVDRVNTVATAMMGLTMECAQCHDHKFDPIAQKEYYQMAAFFNNVKELGMTGDDGNYGPMLLLPAESTRAELDTLRQAIDAQRGALQLAADEVAATDAFLNDLPPVDLERGRLAYFPLDRKTPAQDEGPFRLDGHPLTRATEALDLAEGHRGRAPRFEDEFDDLFIEEVGLFEYTEPYSASAWINTEKRQAGKTQVIMGTAGNKNNFWRGWDFYLDSLNRLNLRLIHSLPHNYLHVRSLDSIRLHTWSQVAFAYDGTGKASGVSLYIDGERQATEAPYDHLYKSIQTIKIASHEPANLPIRVGRSNRAFTGENGFFKGRIDEINLYGRRLTDLEADRLARAQTAEATFIAHRPGEEAATDRSARLDHYLASDPDYAAARRRLTQLLERQLAIVDTVPEIMVMEEMPEPRSMHVLNRGQYDQPLEAVAPGTPEAVLPFPDSLPANRLGLARWLFLPDNPLTARVTVNRYWQLFFGRGLVDTPQDFGSQGSLPTHPQLLDWLAVSFRDSGWDLRALCRMIVLSSTYRQASTRRPELQAVDPGNRLLARGPSYRLPAEMIRDNALAASGLLVRKVGGKSVRPYQPDSLWIELGNFSHMLLRYRQDHGDSLYRRSLYTFIRRTSPPPFLTTFDAPNRDVCVVQRERTNTPLQALNLLNDPQFVEAARVLADRVQGELPDDLQGQLRRTFRLLTSRRPSNSEMEVLKDLYEEQYAYFTERPAEAKALLTVGEHPTTRYPAPRTAALAQVASTVMNHDGSYTKR